MLKAIFLTVFAVALVATLLLAPAFAQPATAPQSGAQVTPPAPGAMPMMDMCGPMMAGGAMSADPKHHAAMMEMRGEMMKTMGELMMKHAQRMQNMPAK